MNVKYLTSILNHHNMTYSLMVDCVILECMLVFSFMKMIHLNSNTEIKSMGTKRIKKKINSDDACCHDK